jgi:hypothetical protein
MKVNTVISTTICTCLLVGLFAVAADAGSGRSLVAMTTKKCKNEVRFKGISKNAPNYSDELNKCFDNPNNY